MERSTARPSEHEAAGIRRVVGVLFNGFTGRQYGTHIVDRDLSLSHALHGMDAED